MTDEIHQPTRYRDRTDLTKKLSWSGVTPNTGGGTDVPVTPAVYDAVDLIATRICGFIGQLEYEKSPNFSKTLIGGVFGHDSVHAAFLNPERYERAKGLAIHLIQSMHGSGEKNIPFGQDTDSQTYFTDLHDFAAFLRKS